MPAYFLFDNIKITDAEALADSAAKTLPTVEAHGGRYVVRGGATEIEEGDREPSFPVMIEFPDHAAANASYNSADYAPLKAQRHAAGVFNATIIASDPPN